MRRGSARGNPGQGSAVAETSAPTLEDLREAGGPAWLWDAARARAVWANAAGLAFFGCETLFDLIDRPFDVQEPGVQRIAALARRLERGQPQRDFISFPSTGSAVPVPCICYLHALADGRTGVLAVGAAPGEAAPAAAPEDVAAAFDLLPSAALIATGEGGVLHVNAAARDLLPPHRTWSFGGLIGAESRAADLLGRLDLAGTISFIERLATRNGERDLRITAKRMGRPNGEAAQILVLLDDVTDRRALERQLRALGPSPTPVPAASTRLSAHDEAVFAALGKALNGEPVQSPPPAPAKSEIPSFVAAAIEARPGAQIIVTRGAVAYANAEALRLLRYARLEDLVRAPGLVAALTQATGGPLPMGDGAGFETDIASAPIPWLNGPAECFTIAPAAPRLAEPEPAPLPQVSAPREPIPAAAPEIPAPMMEEEAAPVSASDGLPSDVDAPDAELRAILDTAADGVITLDAKGRIRNFSAGAEAIFGYRTAEVADKPFADLLAPENRKPLREYLAALDGPGINAVFNDGREVSAIVKQGGEVPLFITIGRLQGKRPGSAAYCAVVRDITQWKKTERELRDAKETAESASRQKSEFLAKISHELRTPLNAILGFSEVMRLERFGEIRNEKYRGYVNDIHASGAHLLALINDLLDLSKVEAGKLELNFTAVNLGEAADHAIKLTQDMATAGRVIVRKSFPVGLPNVVADQRSIRQILLNLLSNAIKFTDPGGQVIVSAQTARSGELKLRVKDTGIGMSETEVKEALEPFRRIAVEGRERQGTGLGLPLTKALAEANRTAFSISSEPRKGTLVEITFPVTRVLAE